MTRFRKKPVVIEAWRFELPLPFVGRHLPEWLVDALNVGDIVVTHLAAEDTDVLLVNTLEGKMQARPGDWLIRGVKGEIYPCKADIFAATYDVAPAASGGMCFGTALAEIKNGAKVARKGWNGKDMFIFLVPGSRFIVNRPPLLGIYEEGTEVEYHAHIDMKTAQGYVVPWLASQADMLAEDWVVVG